MLMDVGDYLEKKFQIIRELSVFWNNQFEINRTHMAISENLHS